MTKKAQRNLVILIFSIIIVAHINIIIFTDATIMPVPNRKTKKEICGSHLTGLGSAMRVYADEQKGMFPEHDKWCDLIILYADVSPRELICPCSDTVLGESSYAINKNIAGKKSTEITGDTVLLFETDYGKSKTGRTVTISSRHFYQEMFGENPEKQTVYKDRWNQSGGPEILTAEHHKGFGAFLFVDGNVRAVPKEDFNKLNWGDKVADPNYENDKTN